MKHVVENFKAVKDLLLIAKVKSFFGSYQRH